MTDVSPDVPIRVSDGRQLPIPGTWQIDPGHTYVGFESQHMVHTRMRGRFRNFSGTLHVADVPEESSTEVTIDGASLDTTNTMADDMLRKEHWLNTEAYPEITFRSTRIEPGDGDRWKIVGDLSIRGETRPAVLDTKFLGATVGPRGDSRISFSAETEINRLDYGMTWNMPVLPQGFMVGDIVRIELDVEAVLDDGATAGPGGRPGAS